MIEDLKGKAVFVTGSSTGIGAAVAKGFAQNGTRVAVHGNSNRAAAEAVVDEIKSAGGEAVLLIGDVSKTEVMTKLVDDAAAALGGLDVLINNAGSMVRRAPLGEMDDALFDEVIDLNVRSVITACRAAMPHFQRRGHGNIITTGSIAARHGGGAGSGLYASAKAFVQNITRNLARELAPANVRVNAVSPGVILTPFHQRYSSPEMLENMRKTIPMARLGKSEDCVGAYLFLASDSLSGYITGQVIEVNGGQLMP